MFQNKALLQNTAWPGLMVVATGLLLFVLYVLSAVFEVVSVLPLIALIILSVGIVNMLGGYILTKRSQYDVYPTTKQVVGGLTNGLFSLAMLFVVLMLLSEGTSAIAKIMYLFACLGIIEFLMQRIFQRKKLALIQILGIGLVIVSVYMATETFSASAMYLYIFLIASVLKEINGRTTGTYLLSPWVNSIWNGVAIVVGTLVALPYIASIEVYKDVTTLLKLPLWVGLAIFFLSISMLLLHFFKRKIMVAKGYMQYKLQVWTGVLLLVALVSMAKPVGLFLLAFLVIGIAYSVIEGRIFIKE